MKGRMKLMEKPIGNYTPKNGYLYYKHWRDVWKWASEQPENVEQREEYISRSKIFEDALWNKFKIK